MTDYDNLINAQDIVRDAAYDARRRTLLTKTINTCETCKGKGHIETAVYHHPTLPDGTQRIEECDECKHTTMKNKYPFKEGDDYWVMLVEASTARLIWSCWDDVSEEFHDENPDTKYYTNDDILDIAKENGIKYKTNT